MTTPLQQRGISVRTSVDMDMPSPAGSTPSTPSSVSSSSASGPTWCNFPRMSLHACLLGSFVLICFSLILFYSVAAYNYDWADASTIAYVSSFGFTLITVVISFRLIFQHLADWRYGTIQRYIVRIIFLLPIYACESWSALYVRSYSLYIETMRETYEAYALWNFLSYALALLGDENNLLQILNSPNKSGRGEHTFPFKLFLNPWTPQEILRGCKFGVLQYVIIKNVTAISACIFESYGMYHEGDFSPKYAYLYLSVMNNYSQTWALYCLIKFYVALKEEMHHQAGKFISVKLVVFVTWWQSLLLNAIAAHTTLVPTLLQMSRKDAGVEGSRFNHQHFHSSELYNWWTEEEIATGIQNFLICFEMFIASLFFSFVFGVADIVRDSKLSLEENQRGGGSIANEGGSAMEGGNEADVEMQTLLQKDISVGPHSSITTGTTTAKRTGTGRVQQAADAFIQSSVPSDLLSDLEDAGRDLYKYSFSAGRSAPIVDDNGDQDNGRTTLISAAGEASS